MTIQPDQGPWTATVATLFPEMFPGPLGHSLAGQALADGVWRLETLDIRDFAHDKHRTVDDAPFGGGASMVMKPDVVASAMEAAKAVCPGAPAIYLSPRGRLLDQARVRELADGPGVTLLCGRYEGVDERAIEALGLEELSLGDFVLSGGEPAALVFTPGAAPAHVMTAVVVLDGEVLRAPRGNVIVARFARSLSYGELWRVGALFALDPLAAAGCSKPSATRISTGFVS